VHSVQNVMKFVFTDHTKEFGWGKESAERLKFSWETIAASQDLNKDFDYKRGINTSFVEK